MILLLWHVTVEAIATCSVYCKLFNRVVHAPTQVDHAGVKHALTPFDVACPHVHVFDAPAVFNNALWLPYRKDHAPIRNALAAVQPVDKDMSSMDFTQPATEKMGGSASDGEGAQQKPLINAIFAHADIVSSCECVGFC
jgi:hypothetical protein